MTTAPRYAIYYAPPPDTPIWAFGSTVLGYDAATGRDIPGFSPAGMTAEFWHATTARPRTYGFHATLKAPFHLHSGDETALVSALGSFALQQAPFRLGPMAVTAIGATDPGHGFVAVTPQAPPPELTALERDVVTTFDRFRQPLSAEDRARRNPDRLSERQRHYLDTYGYPHVLEEFRFHMTLSGETANAADIADALADRMAADIGTVDLLVDALCLFRQESPTDRFRIIARHPFPASPGK